MTFDLTNDANEFRNYLRSRISQYANLAGALPVKLLEVGFQFDQGGAIVVHFDCRPNAQTDGTWTMRYQGNTLDRLHWPELTERVFESSVTFIKLDGASRTLPNDCSKSANLEQEMASLLGEMLRDSMIDSIASHELDPLPKAPGFMIGIEELNGNYGWLSDGTTL